MAEVYLKHTSRIAACLVTYILEMNEGVLILIVQVLMAAGVHLKFKEVSKETRKLYSEWVGSHQRIGKRDERVERAVKEYTLLGY